MCSLWQIYMCAYLHHTALEITSLPVSHVNDLHTKNSPQSVKKNEILAARALFRIYMKNAIVFSQSDARNFFMYKIKPQIWLLFEFGSGTLIA